MAAAAPFLPGGARCPPRVRVEFVPPLQPHGYSDGERSFYITVEALATIEDLAKRLRQRFLLLDTTADVAIQLSNATLPPWQSIDVLRDNDHICIVARRSGELAAGAAAAAASAKYAAETRGGGAVEPSSSASSASSSSASSSSTSSSSSASSSEPRASRTAVAERESDAAAEGDGGATAATPRPTAPSVGKRPNATADGPPTRAKRRRLRRLKGKLLKRLTPGDARNAPQPCGGETTLAGAPAAAAAATPVGKDDDGDDTANVHVAAATAAAPPPHAEETPPVAAADDERCTQPTLADPSEAARQAATAAEPKASAAPPQPEALDAERTTKAPRAKWVPRSGVYAALRRARHNNELAAMAETSVQENVSEILYVVPPSDAAFGEKFALDLPSSPPVSASARGKQKKAAGKKAKKNKTPAPDPDLLY